MSDRASKSRTRAVLERYEIRILVGPCTQAEAEKLTADIRDFVDDREEGTLGAAIWVKGDFSDA